jgi:4-methylaminobutanoate oxidase (formaldehyde-forming)
VINIVGPRARDILQATTDDDLSNAAFPYLTLREIEIGLGRARAARVGYVGELGWELHVPAEYALHVHEALTAAGRSHGLIDAGYRAIESLRLEKGYAYWSAEVTPDTNPYEAGLGFAVALEKGDFIGREALRRIRDSGPARKLATLAVDGFAPLIGGETIIADGAVVGTTTSAGYGYTIGKTIALGYLPAGLGPAARLDIEAYGKLYRAERGPRSLHDPKGERLKS